MIITTLNSVKALKTYAFKHWKQDVIGIILGNSNENFQVTYRICWTEYHWWVRFFKSVKLDPLFSDFFLNDLIYSIFTLSSSSMFLWIFSLLFSILPHYPTKCFQPFSDLPLILSFWSLNFFDFFYWILQLVLRFSFTFLESRRLLFHFIYSNFQLLIHFSQLW